MIVEKLEELKKNVEDAKIVLEAKKKVPASDYRNYGDAVRALETEEKKKQ